MRAEDSGTEMLWFKKEKLVIKCAVKFNCYYRSDVTEVRHQIHKTEISSD